MNAITPPYVPFNLGEFPACHCNDAIDVLAKAMAEDPHGEGPEARSMWAPHENGYITAHVEDVSQRLSAIVEHMMAVVRRLLQGERFGQLVKAYTPWLQWTPLQFEQARDLLEAKPAEFYELEDWMLVADYLIQRYLPPNVIQDEAQYLAVRAAILGKIQAAQHRPDLLPPRETLEAWASLTPTSFAEVPARILSPIELMVIRFAQEEAAQWIQNVTDKCRAKMKATMLRYIQAREFGQQEGTWRHLATALFDGFGELNRDFRRIAITEGGEASLQGFIAAMPVGSRVQRREAYRNACKWCRSIDGVICTVFAPNDPARLLDRESVWVGKSNIGRSGAQYKRTEGGLIERAPNERLWIAAGVQHPHCRGVWLHLPDAPAGASPEFLKYMQDMIKMHRDGVDLGLTGAPANAG